MSSGLSHLGVVAGVYRHVVGEWGDTRSSSQGACVGSAEGISVLRTATLYWRNIPGEEEHSWDMRSGSVREDSLVLEG